MGAITRAWAASFVVLLVIVAVVLGACGSGDDPAPAPASGASVTEEIGANGGTVAVGSLTLQVPAGAAPAGTKITITESTVPTPDDVGAVTPLYTFSPEGLVFATPITVRFALRGPSEELAVFWSLASDPTTFEPIATTFDAAGATASVSHFSAGFVGARARGVAPPVFTPAAGSYTTEPSVTITTTTPGATIRYTTDGTDPTALSPVYAAPISISRSTTLKAIATRRRLASSVSSASYSITTPSAVSPPTFSPPGGVFTSALTVSLATETPDATIHYTTDGSDPSIASASYTTPLEVATTTTIKAIATKVGSPPSAISTGVYVVSPVAATPTFVPAEGAYASPQTVTIASATPGATIRYTLDGTPPTSASPVYTGPISVPGTTTVRAIATKPGLADSASAAATYTIVSASVSAPTFTPLEGTYATPQSVSITTATAGATIHYTLDGTNPTTASAVYTGPISVPTTTTIRALAVKPGLGDSPISSAIYAIVPATPVVSAPTFTPPSASYAAAVSVSITTATAGATIHYTLDGTNPTTASAVYSGPITVTSATTIRAMAVKAGYTDSAVSVATYVVTVAATAPTIAPPEGTYASAQSVSIATSTPGATIYYTLDGSLPTVGSALYTGPFAVGVSSTVRALAVAPGYGDSAVSAAMYTITPGVSAPTYGPLGGTYSSPQSVTISTTTPGATIYYTLDGSAPTTSSSLYTGPIGIATTTTVRALAVKPGYSDSPSTVAIFTIVPTVSAPIFTPNSGAYAGPVLVTIATITAGASIYYTLNGSDPDTGSLFYTGPFLVSTTTTVRAIAVKAGLNDSDISSATFQLP